MNIDTLNENKIKICLTDDEINSLFGGYDMIDYDKPRSRMVLNTLLSSALKEESIPLDCKRILIEVRPICGGCSILFTRVFERPKRLKRVQNAKGFLIVFETSENLLCFLKRLEELKENTVKVSLLKIDGKFVIHLITDSIFLKDRSHLKEYGAVLEEKSVKGAYILEHSDILIKKVI